MGMPWGHAVNSVVHSLAVPYGFTVVLWSTGALAIARYGFPKPIEVVLFGSGAMAAYLVFAGLVDWLVPVQDQARPLMQLSRPILNIVPVAPPILTALVTREIKDRKLAFLASGLTSTATYIIGLVVLVKLS